MANIGALHIQEQSKSYSGAASTAQIRHCHHDLARGVPLDSGSALCEFEAQEAAVGSWADCKLLACPGFSVRAGFGV